MGFHNIAYSPHRYNLNSNQYTLTEVRDPYDL